MEETARKCFKDHKNPLTKLDSIGQRLFLKNKEDCELLKNGLKSLEKALKHSKVERRKIRIKGQWLQDKNLTKICKPVKNYGFQDKSGIYLYPEETLFLLESNRLELTLNEIPLSIQDCYAIFLKLSNFNLNKYLIYKKIASNGHRLLRYELILKINHRKRKLEKSESFSNKIAIEENENSKSVKEFFKKLQEKAPRENERLEKPLLPDYCLFKPGNKHRREYDFNLIINNARFEEISREKDGKLTIFGLCKSDNVSFYELNTIQLPNLI